MNQIYFLTVKNQHKLFVFYSHKSALKITFGCLFMERVYCTVVHLQGTNISRSGQNTDIKT